jgi:hypothetical protein
MSQAALLFSAAHTGPTESHDREHHRDHLLPAAGAGDTVAEDRQLPERLLKRSALVRADAGRTGCCDQGQGTVSIDNAPERQLLHRE